MKSVIALVGLAIEAGIVGAPAMIADGDRTVFYLRDAVRQGARGIISFGVCGGLDPKLRPGNVAVASSVFAAKDEAYPADPPWAEELVRMIPGASYSAIAGVASPMKSLEERRDFHGITGAVAADMESHIVARIASELRIPFAVCRVVLNPAHRRLPRAALINIGSAGKPELRKIGRSLIQDPGQLPSLSRLAVDAVMAVMALRSIKQRLSELTLVSRTCVHEAQSPFRRAHLKRQPHAPDPAGRAGSRESELLSCQYDTGTLPANWIALILLRPLRI